MLAARNRRFRFAAALVGAVGVLLTAGEVVDANRLGQMDIPGGWLASASIFVAAYLVGACGWLVVARAFGAEIDWRRLRLGGTIVAVSHVAAAVGSVYRLVVFLPDTHDSQLRLSYIGLTAANLLVAAAAVTIVSGVAESRRGPVRAARLRTGVIVAVTSYLCTTVSLLIQQAFYSAHGASHEVTIGTIVDAVGSFGFVAAALAFARGATRPLGRREAALAGAAVVAVAGALCVAGGQALIATGYTGPVPVPDSVFVAAWLNVAAGVVNAVALACLALGARAASSGPPDEFAVITA